jgi:hypothetical protein
VALNVKLPWISREHHLEVVAAKNALILSLEAQNAVLAERLAEPVAVSVKLPENFAMVQPAVVRRRKADAPSPDAVKEAPEIDWSTVDPDNAATMAMLAVQEFGRMVGPVELDQWARRVKLQIAASKMGGGRTPQIGSVGKPIPPEILAEIEAAERV